METGLAVAAHFFVCNDLGLDDLAKKKKKMIMMIFSILIDVNIDHAVLFAAHLNSIQIMTEAWRNQRGYLLNCGI